MATPITSKCYKIGTDYPRGYGVVIVNSFLGENEGERKGAEVEIKNLSSLFKDFGLEARIISANLVTLGSNRSCHLFVVSECLRINTSQ